MKKLVLVATCLVFAIFHAIGNYCYEIKIDTIPPLLEVEGNAKIVNDNGNVELLVNAGDGDTTSLKLIEGTGFGYEFQYVGSGTTDRLHLWSRQFSGNEGIRMTWLKNGNVGIGDSNPSEKLEVNGNVLTSGTIVSTGTFIQVKDGNQGLSLIPNAAEGYVKIDVGGTGHAGDDIILGETGAGTPNNVGIGTDSPDTRLHISGTDNNGTTATLKVTSGTQSILMDGNEIDAISSDLHLQHNTSSDVILVTGGGNVGIGTLAPEYPLHIENPGTSGQTTSMVLESATSKRPLLLFSENASGIDLNDGMSIEYDGTGAAAAKKLNFNKTGGNPAMTIENGGDVGINISSPSSSLHILQPNSSSGAGIRLEEPSGVNFWDIFMDGPSDELDFNYNGTLKASIRDSDGAYIQVSDRSLKQDINHLGSVLSKTIQLRPVSYRYKSHPDTDPTIGFIAQEVELLFPEVVSEQKGMKGVNYGAFSVVAIQAIKELAVKNDQLTNLLESQQLLIQQYGNNIDKLNQEVAALKELIKTQYSNSQRPLNSKKYN